MNQGVYVNNCEIERVVLSMAPARVNWESRYGSQKERWLRQIHWSM